jgi:hypothetical protein
VPAEIGITAHTYIYPHSCKNNKSHVKAWRRSLHFYVDINLDKFYVDIKTLTWYGPAQVDVFKQVYAVHKLV